MDDDVPNERGEDISEEDLESVSGELADDDVAGVAAGEAGAESLVPFPPLPPLPPFPG